MKILRLLVLSACLGVLHAEATTDEMLADPEPFFDPDGGQLITAMGDLSEQGVLIARMKDWEKDLEQNPKSLQALLRVLAARLYFNDERGGETVEGDYPQPLWMRLRREGDNFEAFISEDGKKWRSLVRQQLLIGRTAYIGVFMYIFRNPATYVDVDHISLEGNKTGPWVIYGKRNGGTSQIALQDGRLELRDVGRNPPDWGWFAAAQLTGDGELTARIVKYDQPDRLGRIGLAVRSAPESDAAHLQMLVQMSGVLDYGFNTVPTKTIDLWRRLVEIAPDDMRFRVGYARETSWKVGYREGADRFLEALQKNPVKSFEWMDEDYRHSNNVVLFINSGGKFDQMLPYVDALDVKDFKDPKVYANVMRATAAIAASRKRPELVKIYLEKAMDADTDTASSPGAMFMLLQSSVRTGDAGQIRATMAKAFALPGSGLPTADARAEWRSGLNATGGGFAPGDVPNDSQAGARRFINLLRQSGRLNEVAAQLIKEPARYGPDRRWDYVRLAVCAAAQMPEILPDISRLEAELPELVRGDSGGSAAPAAPSGGIVEWIGGMLSGAQRVKVDPQSTENMFLCVPDFYAWSDTRKVAEKWLNFHVAEKSQYADDRMEAAGRAFDYTRWANEPERADAAIRECAGLMLEQLQDGGGISDFSNRSFLPLVTAMAQHGLADRVNRIADLMRGKLSTVGPYSTALVRAEADFPTAEDSGIVTVWPGGADGRGALNFSIDATPPQDGTIPLSEMRYALARTADANKGRERTVELQASPDGHEWHSLGTMKTSQLSGKWNRKIPAEDRYVRAFSAPGAAESATIVRLPAGPNLLSAPVPMRREPAGMGEDTLAGWETPRFSTVHLRKSELTPDAQMVTWISQDGRSMQVIASKPVPVDATRRYQLSGWLRTNHTGSEVARFGLSFRNKEGKEVGSFGSRILRIPTWQYAQIFFGRGTDHPFPKDTAS
ncbi:MAG: hypothetical protein ACREKL_03085, partial [Chthoniobacterales bacterium]